MKNNDDDYEPEPEQINERTIILHHPQCPRGQRLRAERKAGPAQVSSEAYRSGWDVTFSGKPVVRGEA
jgi:hypothetical protein